MPELPTVQESGLRDYESSQWYGVLAPAGTAEEILNSLNGQIVKIVQSADIKRRLIEDGLVPVGNTRQQFADYIKSELVKWAKVVRQSGARID
jgi:tripartite-type tricarboxylate transporter receptor subunit TctC